MTINELWNQFTDSLSVTTWYEYLAVASGIASVWFSRLENVLVYPVGLINTIIYVYLSIDGQLIGEASVNFYYTVMSIIGWIAWMRKDKEHQVILKITRAGRKEWLQHLLFFGCFYAAIFSALTFLKSAFFEGAIPWADAFASATAFTGMWLMTKKKMESWYWWISTNIASIPLYFIKGYVVTSLYYVILLVMAFFGLAEWRKRSEKAAAHWSLPSN